MMASFRIFGKIFRQAIRPAPSLTRPPSAGFFRRTGEKSSAGRGPIETAGCARTCAGREDHVCEGWISVENDFLHCLVFAWLIGESSPHLTMNHYVQVLTVLLHIFSLV